MKIISWLEDDTPGPMAKALDVHHVPYRLDQGHDGWMFSVLPRDWIFVKSLAAEAGFSVSGIESDAESGHFASGP